MNYCCLFNSCKGIWDSDNSNLTEIGFATQEMSIGFADKSEIDHRHKTNWETARTACTSPGSDTAANYSLWNFNEQSIGMECETLKVGIISGKGFVNKASTSNYCVQFNWRGKPIQTFVKTNSKEPEWHSFFNLDWDKHNEHALQLDVVQMFAYPKANVIYGSMAIDLTAVRVDAPSKGWYQLQTANGELLLSLESLLKTEDKKKKDKQVNSDSNKLNLNYSIPTASDSDESYDDVNDNALEIYDATKENVGIVDTAARKHYKAKPMKCSPLAPVAGHSPTKPFQIASQLCCATPPNQQSLDTNQIGMSGQLKSLFPRISGARIEQALQQSCWQLEAAVDSILTDQIATIQASIPELLNQIAPQFTETILQIQGAFNMFHGKPHVKAKPKIGQIPSSHVASPTSLVPASGRRKALLIGINYLGTNNALRGCIEDVHRFQKLISTVYQFPTDCNAMTILTDDLPDKRFHPTKRVMLRAFEWLVRGARKGDVLFFHFSGHGSQQLDKTGDEISGYDDTILPVDFKTVGHITDDLLNEILVNPLEEGVKLTCVMDCCHSGTGMDLPYIMHHQRGAWDAQRNPKFAMADVQMFSGSKDEQTSADVVTSNNGIGGAMSMALVSSLIDNPFGYTYHGLLSNINRIIKNRGFEQTPQLSSSQNIPTTQKFSFVAIHPNSNAVVGRQFEKQKVTECFMPEWAKSCATIKKITNVNEKKKKAKPKKSKYKSSKKQKPKTQKHKKRSETSSRCTKPDSEESESGGSSDDTSEMSLCSDWDNSSWSDSSKNSD